MSNGQSLRLWPGITIAAIEVLVIAAATFMGSDGVIVGLLGGIAAALLIFLWWLFFSRAAWTERIGAFVLMAAGVIAAKSIAHPSIVGAGQGMLMYMLPLPLLALALVGWAAITQSLRGASRYTSLAAAIVIACTPFVLVRTAGVRGGGAFLEPHWRWTPTPEEILLATAKDDPKPPPPAPAVVETPKEEPKAEPKTEPKPVPSPIAAAVPDEPILWPGFRGASRDSVIHGVSINTDWAATPPVQLWRRPIGPGWSSFSVQGDLIYTQEQRGDDEIVACYRLSTGEPVWKHKDHVRFYESNGGAGPRATPTLSGGRAYAFGATGMLNALDARTGAVIWSRNAAADTKRKQEFWGFTSSPLVLDDSVVVAVAGTLASYDRATGKPRWIGPQHGGSYSSPSLVTIDGVQQILLLAPPGVISVAPADGKLLWEHTWDGGAIVQPNMTGDGDILISAMTMTGGEGVRRINVSNASGAWKVDERWTSNGLKPYFNDYVVHKGHAYGFDNSIMSCIDLTDGKRVWKGGRYGNGQVFLLADQDVLLVTTEEGEIALVSATPDKFTEIAKIPALDGKTWNHPVLVGDRLLVRNGQEMAAFRVTLASKSATAEEKQ